ncbi:protein arginine nmethyltransferase 2, putative [Acanthamoeba castellanii str. Neff]|jgi:protein arginine N-methyltransferase 2|uniref:Protein arginine nmethyltransferase 2, putative n=1 Tax=Acanthamoeba castellanii (strain ATCC 30010 / Neff) TaxID=1257118 RepID=L8H399_ACACF|nr:protein arginine nmethyltransferase 2, putative [Acanthamoeba castellanii str. Neff]ELR19188.1 protein arginine nmethyltransferase 2, putative [Acanthamoeba castellanii str. Neff]
METGGEHASLPPVPPRDDSNLNVEETLAASSSAMDHYEGNPASAAHDSYENQRYFEEYGKFGIHVDMLRDQSRMTSYHRAIMGNPQDFKDKVVLDVGCGTSVLSCWCARAGARKVYAVEASSMAEQAQLVVDRNGLSDIVQIINAKMEDVNLPEQVDVIVSEWMGSFLIFESMLETVLYARDRYLKEDGKMYPAIARMFVAPLDMTPFFQKRIRFLRDVPDLNLAPLIPFATTEYTYYGMRGAKCKPKHLLADGFVIKELDIKTVTAQELQRVSAPIAIKPKRKGTFNGWGAWFEVVFPGQTADKDVVLSTAPEQPLTHWRQDVFLLERDFEVTEEDTITGLLRFVQNPNWKRHYNLEISFSLREFDQYRIWST